MAADILKLWMHSFSNECMMRADPPSLQPPDKLKSTLPPLMSWIMLCCVNCQATSDKKLFGQVYISIINATPLLRYPMDHFLGVQIQQPQCDASNNNSYKSHVRYVATLH